MAACMTTFDVVDGAFGVVVVDTETAVAFDWQLS